VAPLSIRAVVPSRPVIPPALRQKLDAQRSEEHVVLTIEEFFEGNEDDGSIGCNLSDPPTRETFRNVLLSIRARPDVQDVLMCVSEDMGDEWPFVDRVFIMTSASEEDVAGWLAPLQADEPYLLDAWQASTDFLPELRGSMRVVVGWWD
jgi:hypothetical protein